MIEWITSLADVGQARGGKNAFLHILFPIFLKSFAIYSVYRALKWRRANQHGRNQSALSSLDTEPAPQRKHANRDREPGGMLEVEDTLREGY